MIPYRLIPSAIFYLTLNLVAVAGFIFALKVWFSQRRSLAISTWRQVVFTLGIAAAGLQIVLFALSWTHILWADRVLFGRWARMLFPSFAVAVPCILAGKGAARWWLLSSSVLLFIICFFVMLSV